MLATDNAPSGSAAPADLRTLDDLARLGADELAARYRAAGAPDRMTAADGALLGRMLAVRGVSGPLAGALRGWARAASFPWEGKSFVASDDRHGRGFNRVKVRGVLGRQDLFPFATSFGPSRVDGRPTLILDYDLARNPAYIRRIHDEIRELVPGLFFGPAMWKHARGATVVLWFGLDARDA